MSYRVLWMQTQQAFDVEAEESLLEAASRQGVPLPHECTFGGCGTCRIKVDSGAISYPDGELPLSMTEEEHNQGFALACQARPQSDLVISVEQGPASSEAQQVEAKVVEIYLHTADTYHLKLALPSEQQLVYVPGQYLNVLLEDGMTRSFSMSSPQDAENITLQIKKIPDGLFTSQHLPQLQPGDTLQLELPHGSFYYRAKDYQPMVFAATGTGFAPVKAIIESLLDDEDCPPIHFYWGVRSESDLYLLEEIESWKSRLYEFSFIPVLSRPSQAWQGRRGYVQDAIVEDLPDLSEFSVYLCGSPNMIQEAKALLALHGAQVEKIYSDSFVFQNDAAVVTP